MAHSLNRIDQAEKTLFKVLDDLKEYLPYLVLVGGWVPHLYRKFLWKVESRLPHSTVDIDLGVIPPSKKYPDSTVYSKLHKLGYGESHLKMDRLFPIVPTVKISKQDKPFPIEFIASPNVERSKLERVIGRQIHINQLKYFAILIDNPLEVPIGKTSSAHIPREANYIWHKLLTFALREETSGKSKDLYYLYYVLRFSPNIEQVIRDLEILRTRKSEAKAVEKNMRVYFHKTLI